MTYLTHRASLRRDGLASGVEMNFLCTVADLFCRRTVNDAICIGCGLVHFQRLRPIALNSDGAVSPSKAPTRDDHHRTICSCLCLAFRVTSHRANLGQSSSPRWAGILGDAPAHQAAQFLYDAHL